MIYSSKPYGFFKNFPHKGYIYGGYKATVQVSNCDEYFPDTWVSQTDIPSPPRYGLASSQI